MKTGGSPASSEYDLVIVGGGPAGSTLGTIVKKYAPGRRVLLLERSAGPRYHIGESLVPMLVPVLREMGVFDKIDAAGFPKKMGATYVWGRDREPWAFDFNDAEVDRLFDGPRARSEKVQYAWQVRRSAYDDLLLRHAEESGVEIIRGADAVSILETGDRVTGVRLRLDSAGEAAVYCSSLADCSGQDGFLSKFRRIRKLDPSLNNVAAVAYFRGAPWKYQYTGHPDKTKIFVCSVDCGWFWYIPIEADVVSIGLVMKADHLKREKITDVPAYYMAKLRECPELAPLVSRAERLRDFEGTGKDFFLLRDWSYLNAAAAGPGWFACGDAAFFVDPILSTGVSLAHLSAHRAAYTLLSEWKVSEPRVRAELWKGYDAFCREVAAQYMVLAHFWYGNDRNAQAWWKQAGEVQRASLPVRLSDRAAFITAAAGFPLYYERMFSTPRVLEEDLRSENDPVALSLLGERVDADDETNDAIVAGTAVPALSYPYRVEPIFLPEFGKGRLQPSKRVRFLKTDDADPVRDALNPKMAVLQDHLELLKRVDGKKTIADIRAELEAAGVRRQWFDRKADLMFLKELYVQGVLAFAKSAGVPGGAR